MHAWQQIQKTVDFIEEHIGEKIEIEELAKIASLSPFYYQRLFSRLVKKTVTEYIRLRRMAKASLLLRQADQRILDIALELGYTSHEHFTRTFKDTFQMTPTEYRKNPVPLNRMTKPELSLYYTLVEEGVPLIIDDIVLEINKRILTEPISFIGLEKKIPVEFIDGLGVDSGIDPLDNLWRDFHKKKETDVLIDIDAEEIGVALPCDDNRYFLYFAGAKVDNIDVGKEYTSWQLQPGEYIVCTLEAENFESLVMDVLYKAQQYLFGTWLPKYNLQTEPFCAERYQSHNDETGMMEVWVKLM